MRRRRLLYLCISAAFCYFLYSLVPSASFNSHLPDVVVEESLPPLRRRGDPRPPPPPPEIQKTKTFHLDVQNPPPLQFGQVSLGVTDRRTVPWCQKSKLVSPLAGVQGVFAKIHPNEEGVYIYSAYYDLGRQQLKVIAAAERRRSGSLLCQLWFHKHSEVMMAVPVSIEPIPEGNNVRYNSNILVCSNRDSEVPYAVSLVHEVCETPNVFLPVIPLPEKPLDNGRFALCVTPLNLNFDKVDRLVEMIGTNQVLGANHFFFYNYSTSDRVRTILDKLDPKLVTVLPWHLPMKVHVWPVPPGYNEEIKYFGQMAMLNECLLRAGSSYEFAVFTDLDEFIVPHKPHTSWKDVVNLHPEAMAAFSFRNTFFKLEWPEDPILAQNKTLTSVQAVSLTHIRREKLINFHGSRSKLIVRPRLVNIMGVHNVWNFVSGRRVANVDVETAVLHHYRNWESMGEKDFVEDRSMLVYADSIVRTLTKLRKDLGLPIA